MVEKYVSQDGKPMIMPRQNFLKIKNFVISPMDDAKTSKKERKKERKKEEKNYWRIILFRRSLTYQGC
tara:strand:- start:370 stop:573 length:204 start_codon:yes stop_codon:yes gene_type:complete